MKIHVKITDDKNQIYEGTMELQKAKFSKTTKTPKVIQTSSKPSTPTAFVNGLYLEKFFENKKTLHDVESKIKSKKYNFDLPLIAMALNRSKFLKREGKRGSYSYIQKIPPK
ncbi:hypothetical protein [Nitrosopumilus sp. S4]